MEFGVKQGDITGADADAIVVNLFQGVTAPGGATGAVDSALEGAISRLIELGDIKGKRDESTLLYSFSVASAAGDRSLLGKSSEFDYDAVRRTGATAARFARRSGVRLVVTIVHGAGIAGLDAEACAQAIAEGTVMGLYQFKRHKKADDDATELKGLVLVEHDGAKLSGLERGVARGVALAEAANFSRDLANEPSNVLTPTELANRAQSWANDAGLECEVFDRAWAEEQKMGAFLGVAQGSEEPPKFIVIRYKGGGDTHLALVGKGVTFDTGGISIKPAAGMEEMKGDMSGAAAVIAAMGAIARLKPPINVTAVAPCTENMPSGTAIKPGDVLYAMSGTTIEVLNTDAEGRLILADALSYAVNSGAEEIIDVATLTGDAYLCPWPLRGRGSDQRRGALAARAGGGQGGRRALLADADVPGVRRPD